MNINDIKNLTAPKKTIKITIFGQEVDVEYKPICGFGLMKLQKLAEQLKEDQTNYQVQQQLVKLTLSNATTCDAQTIQFLIDNDMFATMDLVQNILEYSGQYNEAKMKQANVSKKKLKK